MRFFECGVLELVDNGVEVESVIVVLADVDGRLFHAIKL